MTWKDLQRSAKSSADNGKPGDDDPFHDFLGKGFEEKPIWAGLYENLRDAVFARKLPPLELTSTPVPTPNRMTVKTNPWAIGGATIANGGVLAILILMGLTTIRPIPISSSGGDVHLKDFTLFAPARGGDGGGSNEQTDPMIGRQPRREDMPLAPVQVAVLERPTMAVAPAVPLQLPDNSSLPNIGVQKSANVSLASSGEGRWTGIGTDSNNDVGPGGGNGPGSDRGPGDSVYLAGTGGVTNPVPIVSPDAEFSDEARRNKYQGVCCGDDQR
jgi:periplasmic protein TonB